MNLAAASANWDLQAFGHRQEIFEVGRQGSVLMDDSVLDDSVLMDEMWGH